MSKRTNDTKPTYVQLKDGETAERTTKVEGDVVTVSLVTRRAEGAPRYAHTWRLDFSGVKRDELLRLAAKTVVIMAQRMWRGLATDSERLSWSPPTVREMLDTERKRSGGGGMQSIKKQLADCKTEKEKIAKLKELGII